MKAIKISNSTIEIEFDSESQKTKFKKQVSYKIPGCEFVASYKNGFWDGNKCFLSSKNRIRTGLFKHIFPEHKLVYDSLYKDMSYEDIPLYKNNPSFDKRQYQLDAINSIFRNKRGLVVSMTGSGKSLIAGACISHHLNNNTKNKILFIVYDKNILNQSIKNFKLFGFNISKFGEGEKDLSGDVIVATIQSLNRLKNPIKTLKDITMCFVDESHNSTSKTSKAILTKLVNCEYYIGLTATPYKKDTLELAELMSVLGPIIFEYGFKEAVENNSITKVCAFFVKTPLDQELKEKLYERKNYKIIWDEGIQASDVRNSSVATILGALIDILDTTNLIYVDRVEHGQLISDKLSKNPKIKYSQMYGEDDTLLRDMKKQALSKLKLNTLISSVTKEGIDMNPSPIVAFNLSGRKNFISLIQFLGRITRKNEKFKNFRVYIDFIDQNNPLLLSHSNERISACEEYGIEVRKFDTIQDLLQGIILYYKECNL